MGSSVWKSDQGFRDIKLTTWIGFLSGAFASEMIHSAVMRGVLPVARLLRDIAGVA